MQTQSIKKGSIDYLKSDNVGKRIIKDNEEHSIMVKCHQQNITILPNFDLQST